MIDGNELPTIVAPRVALRWLTESDADALFGIFSNPTVMRFWSTPPMSDVAQARKLVADIHEGFRTRHLFQWGVVRLDDDQVIGTCTLFAINQSQGRAEVGYALGHAFWGHGYMKEALTALVDFAFGELGMRRLEADVDPRNAGSLHAVERLGFRREGVLRERWKVNGELQDSVMLGLLSHEWRTGAAE
jgi:[ribosomal protein S5]-alanine N-acetyltransferase